ncbi:hypothetical protein ASE63_23085 [Bosea sp. Root381]|nr:hypothetical protein ASE63_23085 [Bosea sp. Root381]
MQGEQGGKRLRKRVQLATNGLSSILLGGASLAALLVASGAKAEGGRVSQVMRGADGRDGETAFLWTSATEGKDGGSSFWVQHAPILNIPSPALEIGSVGGAGGSVYSKGVFHNLPGQRGGNGGVVSLILAQSAEVSGRLGYATSAHERSSPLIHVYSRGGTGGLGYTSWTESETGIARGGDGGRVTLSIASRVTAYGGGNNPLNLSLPAIYVMSEGGAAGIGKVDGRRSADGTYDYRVDVDRGGSGGDVGVTLEGSAAVTVQGALAPAVSVNSFGGNGGHASNSGGYPSNAGGGGQVSFNNYGSVTTNGANSPAVILQSVGGIGGGGANGAFTSGTPGGRGGRGGNIDAKNYGSIATRGDYSLGLMAQSVGGVGGNGGGAAFTSGGDGGGAGLGGTVEITNTGRIETRGTGSAGIVAQSVGGGSALDAFHLSKPVVSGSGGGSGGSSGILPFTSGGTGGTGGIGGAVTLKHSGSIITSGDSAYGALLQSVGGGGGTGGVASSSMAFLAVALGGAGGGGGAGGEVTFRSSQGNIETAGKGATALLAQSVGGGGGTGGYASAKSTGPGLSASSATGGSGGMGGNGGHVLVDNGSAIITRGEAALGLQAISIGGGGGTGGGAGAFALALPAVTPSGQPLPSIALTNAIGGSGGAGGHGRTVKVYNKNAGVETFGVGSIGIQAQSVGGGGGNAGNALAYGLAIAAPGATALNVTNTIGGTGGGGGSGDFVHVYNDGSVATHGDGAFGIQAQSIGGGGGNGGSASSSADALSLYRTVALGQTIGGTGSKGGGDGGPILVENRGRVETRGAGATGILLQSIGGGGGNGGAVNASAASGLSFDKTLNSLVQKLPLADSVTMVNAIGGNGGSGGNGGKVQAILSSQSLIRTQSSQADGLFAQSVGGGGGMGGGGSAAAEGTLSVSLSFGGRGGTGGTGGVVDVSNAGTIETRGDASHGIFLQSVGGGGGNGGNLTAAPDDTPDTVGELWATLKKAVGVDAYQEWAGDKKNAETKENLDALIKDIQNSDTYKSLADSFKKSDFYKQAQSFGKNITDYLDKQSKGSVKRPDVSLTLSMGGDGGSGNVGGTVLLNHSGLVVTGGDVSHGVFAQSVGGGGGQGGLAYSSGSNKTNLGGTLGGKGGHGNLGGQVTLTNEGTIRTAGEASYGIYAQSVGGGGGVGVGALSSDNKNLVLNLTVGGNGGTGGNGGEVTVNNYGTVETRGNEAHAVVAQSIGGGGGAFLMNPASASDAGSAGSGDEKAASASTIAALLKAVGIEKVPAAAQGSSDKKPSSKSGSFTLGGSGGASGAGGTVKVNHGGPIRTTGEAAFGILAQSIGGGGGISNAAGSPGGVKYAASYGGKGGAAGNGGNIHVMFSNNAAIQTTGDNSIAVFAQTIGGGGGYGGASVLQGWTLPVFGGEGRSSGDGGFIEIGSRDGTVRIDTKGAEAHGIFAQTLGGGGGMVSDLLKTDKTVRSTLEATASVLAGIISKTGGSGTVLDNIDKVPEEFQGVVRLLGNDTDTVNSVLTKITENLDKRSASRGTGGEISVHLKGNIQTTGAGSYGIFAQSGFQKIDGLLDESRYGGNITVDYSGVLRGGAGDGAAIVVDGGQFNTIVIGAGSHVSAVSNQAVISTFGQEKVLNYGTLVGDINLTYRGTNEWNEFRNEVGGTYISAGSGTINISNRSGWFYNGGTFDVGGVGQIATATVKNVDTHLAGRLRVDVNSVAPAGAQNADLLKTAKLTIDGVAIRPYSVDGLLPGSSFTVVSASSISTNNPETAGVSPESPVSWSASRNGNSIAISPSADFVGKARGSLTNTERSLLGSLQQAWNSGNVTMAGTFADLANIDTAEQYGRAINSLTATEDHGQSAVNQTLDARKSLTAALSCPLFEGSSTSLRETQCVWGRIVGSRMIYANGVGNDGSTQNGLSYRVGGQWELSPDWFLGATASYNLSRMRTSDRLTSIDGKGADVAISLKHQAGPWLLAGALHGGYGSFDSDTNFFVGDNSWNARNNTEVWTAGLRLRAAYELAFDGWYLRPSADLDLLHTHMPGYTLSGSGATFRADAIREWSMAFEPTLEAGARIDLGKDQWLRPYVSIGGTFLSGDGLSQRVSFSEDGGPGITFASTSSMPDKLFNLGTGLHLFAKAGYELRAEYKAQLAKDFANQEFSVRMAVPF